MRDVILSDFVELGIFAEMERRNWGLYLRNKGEAVVDLVREFYSNAEIINGAIRTYVRGTYVDVDEDYIREMRQEVPRVPSPAYPPRKNVALNIVGTELTGVTGFSWSGRRFLRQGELTDKYKMLNLIAVSNLALIRQKK